MSKNIKLTREPGFIGNFTRNQANGAIKNGSRIIKIFSDYTDAHPNGSVGTVLGSIGPHIPPFEMEGRSIKYGYFIEWDQHKKAVVLITDFKISEIFKGAEVKL